MDRGHGHGHGHATEEHAVDRCRCQQKTSSGVTWLKMNDWSLLQHRAPHFGRPLLLPACLGGEGTKSLMCRDFLQREPLGGSRSADAFVRPVEVRRSRRC